jgi:hypothetical protein
MASGATEIKRTDPWKGAKHLKPKLIYISPVERDFRSATHVRGPKQIQITTVSLPTIVTGLKSMTRMI